MHALAFVFEAIFLYFKESKKVMSFFCAKCKGLTLFTKKLLVKYLLEKILFNLRFFFFKKKI